MSGSMMEWAVGGVRGDREERTGGQNVLPKGPSSPAYPTGAPVRQVPTKDGGIGTSIGGKATDRDQALRNNRKPEPTPPAPPRKHPNPQTPIPGPVTQSTA
ncbi:hypothetical protein ATANTOWER_023371 [Ataeniobius toweri]|uniref:Uncharacterized protein n=1 Tax=Ataeniobius toweri TaxID=208326 RepID=A0ABU7C336_9TELE|nr:hypothetical protein [Ataeniobius toweri]